MSTSDSESEKNAHELVEKFCKSLCGTWSIIKEEEKPILFQLLLHVYKSGALGQRDLFYKMISRVQQHRLGSIHDIRMTKWFGSLPDFNVLYPIPETLPEEDKKP
jgi:hypothetical protein